eukprot:4075834-Amphidinium_carterae.1
MQSDWTVGPGDLLYTPAGWLSKSEAMQESYGVHFSTVLPSDGRILEQFQSHTPIAKQAAEHAGVLAAAWITRHGAILAPTCDEELQAKRVEEAETKRRVEEEEAA